MPLSIEDDQIVWTFNMQGNTSTLKFPRYIKLGPSERGRKSNLECVAEKATLYLCDEKGDGEEGTMSWSSTTKTVTLNTYCSEGQSSCCIVFGQEVYNQWIHDLNIK